jgi:hypothetical protein
MVQIVYTNSACSDIWEPFLGQLTKFSDYEIYMISDVDFEDKRIKKIFTYDNNDPYYKVWTDALNFFSVDYFIYLQEDFFLYSNVNNDLINKYLKFLKNNDAYSFVRLIKSGNLKKEKIYDKLYEIESTNSDIFSMQATIWNTQKYIDLLNDVKSDKWLENNYYRDSAIKMNLKGLYHYDNENKRGLMHYDSNVYPYIATALVRGKWNISEYQNELLPIILKYKIDLNKRGTI